MSKYLNAYFLAALVFALAALPVLAQTGTKKILGDKIDEAVQGHNDAINGAISGKDPVANPTIAVPAVPAATAALTIKSGWITRAAKDAPETKTRLYFAYPEPVKGAMAARLPGLIVIQEWWGVNEDIQARTREFAERGYYAVAVDLYNGQATDDPKKAAELKKAMDSNAGGTMTSLKTGLDLLQEEAKNGLVDESRIGAIGWCMGGQQSLLLSIADARVKATAVFYGGLVTDPEKLKALQGPVLGVFGNNDKGPSPEDVNKFEAGLKAAGIKDVSIYRYDGVGHAFASKAAEKMGMYNEEKAKDAWAKTYVWLAEKLQKAK